jgi:hypothetical protein
MIGVGYSPNTHTDEFKAISNVRYKCFMDGYNKKIAPLLKEPEKERCLFNRPVIFKDFKAASEGIKDGWSKIKPNDSNGPLEFPEGEKINGIYYANEGLIPNES